MIRRLAYPLTAISLLTVFSGPASAVPSTPEEQTMRAARRLKPIGDEEWRKIAGDRLTNRYEIVRGDTLSEISGRLFGDIKYWPKVWALNNDSITNPHLIRPGNAVQFDPGSAGTLPTVSIEGAGGATDASSGMLPAAKRRGGEWRNLPAQDWEKTVVSLPPEVDPDGFDRRSKINKGHSDVIENPALAASEKIDPLGFISASRTEARTISLNDTVYIEAETELKPGETYAISQNPNRVSGNSGSGYAYPILGKVKILGQRGDIFIGVVIQASDILERESFLMPLPPPVHLQNPVPGPNDLEAVILTNSTLPGMRLTQHRFAFVDRGTKDGIAPGMVFRAFQHRDPSNNQKITSDDFITFADFMVVQTSAEISLVVVLSSLSPIIDETTVHLLTNVDDVGSGKGFIEGFKSDFRSREKPELPKLSPEEEKAEALDRAGGPGKLTEEQAEELKQLERWKGNEVPTEPGAGPAVEPGSEPAPETATEPEAEPTLPPTQEPAAEQGAPSAPSAPSAEDALPALEPEPEPEVTPTPTPTPAPTSSAEEAVPETSPETSPDTEDLQGLTEE